MTSTSARKGWSSTQPDWRTAFMPSIPPSTSPTHPHTAASVVTTTTSAVKTGIQLDTTTKVKAGHKPAKRVKPKGHDGHVNAAASNEAGRAHSWEYLPLDLALNIVHYLPIHDKLLIVSRLNRFWHEVIYSQPTAWQHDTLCLHSRMSDEHILQIPLTSPVHHVRSLEMTNRQCQTDGRYARLLSHVAALAPKLTRLDVAENLQLALFNAVPIMQMHSLQHLTITLGEASADPLISLVSHLAQLQSLHYTPLSVDSERTRLLKFLASHHHSLTSLAECQNRDEHLQPAWSVESLAALARITTLRNLHIRVQSEECALQSILSMRHINSLQLALYKPYKADSGHEWHGAGDHANVLAQLATNDSRCFAHLQKLTLSHDEYTRPTICADESMQLMRAFAASRLQELHWANDRWPTEHIALLCSSPTLQQSLRSLTLPHPQREQMRRIDPIVISCAPLLQLTGLTALAMCTAFSHTKHHLHVLQQHPTLQTVTFDVTASQAIAKIRRKVRFVGQLQVITLDC